MRITLVACFTFAGCATGIVAEDAAVLDGGATDASTEVVTNDAGTFDAGATTDAGAGTTDAGPLPLFTFKTPTTGRVGGAPTYLGAFLIENELRGESDLAYSGATKITRGTTADRLFLTGHDEGTSGNVYLAEATIPALVKGTDLNALNIGTIRQVFRSIRKDFSTTIDSPVIGGMYFDARVDPLDGDYVGSDQLFVSAYAYYDAGGRETHNFGVYRDGTSLSTSGRFGLFDLGGAAHASGYMLKIPPVHKQRLHSSTLEATHIVGVGGGMSIVSRTSVGPSLFLVNINDLGPTRSPSTVSSQAVLDYPHGEGTILSGSIAEWGTNVMWNSLSFANAVVLVPGTRTLMFIGGSWDGRGAICYKCTNDVGTTYGGYGTTLHDAYTSFYWLYDLDEVAQTITDPTAHPTWSHRPYEFGALPFTIPFADFQHFVTGGYYEPTTRRLVLAIGRGASSRLGAGVPLFSVFDLGVGP